jgi:hypothetical protein
MQTKLWDKLSRLQFANELFATPIAAQIGPMTLQNAARVCHTILIDALYFLRHVIFFSLA